MLLNKGTLLYAPDRGYGDKHGKIIHVPTDLYTIKWEEYERSLPYGIDELPRMIRTGHIEVLPLLDASGLLNIGLRAQVPGMPHLWMPWVPSFGLTHLINLDH